MKNIESQIYYQKMNQTYSGLIFDLDGTLLNQEGLIESNIKLIIRNLTKNGVHIILATGRGPNDTDKIIKDNNLFTKNKAFSINFNGSLIKKITNTPNGLDSKIIKEHLLNNVEIIFQIIIKDNFLNSLLILESDLNHIYSDYDKYGITLHFKKEFLTKYNIVNDIYNKIYNLLKVKGYEDVQITVSETTIDIFSNNAGKEKGIIETSKKLSIKEDSLLRIGDLGGTLGNDYCMLKDFKGITVDQGVTAIKVFSQQGDKLLGQKAINQIFNDIKLKSSLILSKDKFNSSYLIEQYSDYSKKIRKRFKITSELLLKEININKDINCDNNINLENIFSKNGSILFTQEEINDCNFDYLLKYIISYGGENYGRGKIFYFFENFTNNDICREIENENDFNKIIEFYYSHFEIIINDFELYQNYIEEKTNYSQLEYKLYLMILDHLKLFTIKLVHFLSFGNIIGLDIKENDLKNTKNNLTQIIEKYYSIFELRKDKNILNINILKRTIEKYKRIALIENGKIDHEFIFYNRLLRGVPEVSNPYINYIYGYLATKGIISKGIENPVIIGTHFGGIELPHIIKLFLSKNGIETKEIIGVHNSRYELDNMEKYLGKNLKYDNKEILSLISNNDVIVSDDGVFSGNTLLSTGLDLSKKGPKKIYFTTQTFPGDRAVNIYKSQGGISNEFLKELYENGLTSIMPIFTGTSNNHNRLFNIIEQRILNIISKGKDIANNNNNNT